MADNQKTIVTNPDTEESNKTNGKRSDISKLDVSPAMLEALKTLLSTSSSDGLEKLTNCDKLAASLEQIRANKNMKMFEKLEELRQEYSGLNSKIAQMEESMSDVKEGTGNLVESLPPFDR